jgi:hypothetical protein
MEMYFGDYKVVLVDGTHEHHLNSYTEAVRYALKAGNAIVMRALTDSPVAIVHKKANAGFTHATVTLTVFTNGEIIKSVVTASDIEEWAP